MHLTLPNGEKYMSSTIPSHHNPGIMCRISLTALIKFLSLDFNPGLFICAQDYSLTETSQFVLCIAITFICMTIYLQSCILKKTKQNKSKFEIKEGATCL